MWREVGYLPFRSVELASVANIAQKHRKYNKKYLLCFLQQFKNKMQIVVDMIPIQE